MLQMITLNLEQIYICDTLLILKRYVNETIKAVQKLSQYEHNIK